MVEEFARLIGLQPSNYCSIESGSLPAWNQFYENLGYSQFKSQRGKVLFDLAAKTRDDIRRI